MRSLEKYLGVIPSPEDDLAIVQNARMPGTCEWFTTKRSYTEWRDLTKDCRTILWVNGKPAVGKSVLAGYIIDQVKELDGACSWFFFKHGDKSRSQLGVCLRSLAFQMALTDINVREKLLEMRDEDIKFDQDIESIMWRKLFLSGIFQTRLRRHYWVIDALDECADFSTFFGPMLTKLDESIPIRIFITSRQTPELERHFSDLSTRLFQSETITTVDTRSDIRSLILSRVNNLPMKDDEDCASFAETVLEKSQGSFLWTVLVLDQLSSSHGEKEIIEVLDDVPLGMERLYGRVLELMSYATRGKLLAKAVLIWTTCATRPLAINELEGALEFDIQDRFPKLKESILALCGQLVTVDKLGKVQMVHETAREFLLDENLNSEFAVDQLDAHTRIARTSLKYLTADEMKPPRTSKYGTSTITARKLAEFSIYACTEVSYHLSKADPRLSDILDLLHGFLKSNVLSWIEAIAQTQTLSPLIDAANNIGLYLNACASQQSLHYQKIQMIRDWTTDLTRMSARFSDALLTSPSAIYSLIPPLCPTQSMIHNTSIPGRRLSLIGFSRPNWGDQLSCMNFQNAHASAMCYGGGFFALGLSSGQISLYHAGSFETYLTLDHGEIVKFLEFNSTSYLLASCGVRTILVWDIRSGEKIYSFEVHRPLTVAFDKNRLMAATSRNCLTTWDLENGGIELPNRPWNHLIGENETPIRKPPAIVSISLSHKLLAVAYAMEPIKLWDLERDNFYGNCGKKLPSGETSSHPVSALVINPVPDIALFAISYLDGELVIVDPFKDQDLVGFRANCHTLAASPDGRLLAGSAGSGIIQIFEFKTLKVLYRINSSNIFIKQLVFDRDSLQVADIRGSQCNVWELGFLLPDLEGDDRRGDTPATLLKKGEETAPSSIVKISSMILHPDGEFAFCGKVDGSVSLYNLKTGSMVRTLYSHKTTVKMLVYWHQHNIIMSVDTGNQTLAMNLKRSQSGELAFENELFQVLLDFGRPIIQAFVGEMVGKFILSTTASDHLWAADGQLLETRTYPDNVSFRKWIEHPQSAHHMICFEPSIARIYEWNDWSEVASVALAFDSAELQLKNVIPYMPGGKLRFLVELSELKGFSNTLDVHLLDSETFNIKNSTQSECALKVADNVQNVGERSQENLGATSILLFGSQPAAFAQDVVHIIGLSDAGKLLFLDTHSWVCSIDLKNIGNRQASYSRHFFVPYDWFSGSRDLISAFFLRDVIFALNDGLVIVKDGLEYAEKVKLEVNIGDTNGKVTS